MQLPADVFLRRDLPPLFFYFQLYGFILPFGQQIKRAVAGLLLQGVHHLPVFSIGHRQIAELFIGQGVDGIAPRPRFWV